MADKQARAPCHDEEQQAPEEQRKVQAKPLKRPFAQGQAIKFPMIGVNIREGYAITSAADAIHFTV